MRAASRLQAGTSMSVPLSTDLDEVEAVYSCFVGMHSKMDEKSLGFYQFTVRGKDCRLIKSLITSDRN